MPPGLVRYAVSWEFNGPLFEPLWRLLDAVGAPGIGMRRVIVAVVVGTGEDGEEVSVGSALSHGDDSEAVVRAVLDALNRRITRPY